MAPKPTPTPIPAAPGAVPAPPPEFGLDNEEIVKVSSAWSGAGDTIGELSFSTAANVVGEGSDVFSAARTSGTPAADAIKSIATRVDMIASLVSAFAKDANATDFTTAEALKNLTQR